MHKIDNMKILCGLLVCILLLMSTIFAYKYGYTNGLADETKDTFDPINFNGGTWVNNSKISVYLLDVNYTWNYDSADSDEYDVYWLNWTSVELHSEAVVVLNQNAGYEIVFDNPGQFEFMVRRDTDAFGTSYRLLQGDAFRVLFSRTY